MLRYGNKVLMWGLRERLTRDRQDSSGKGNESQDSELHFACSMFDKSSLVEMKLIEMLVERWICRQETGIPDDVRWVVV